jgi:two-component system sensor histidine kinase KdpD
MAAATHAPLIAAYVESPSKQLSPASKSVLDENLALAERVGGEVVRLVAARPGDAIVAFARSSAVTRIVVGRPTHARWRDVLRRTFLDDIVRASDDIDVSVVAGETLDDRRPSERASRGITRPRVADQTVLRPYVLATAIVAISTVVALLVRPYLELADIVMIYLVGIMFVSTRADYRPSLVAGVVSVLSLDFFCVPPYLSFAVSDLAHVPTFAVMLLVAAVMTTLTNRMRVLAVDATDRERQTAALYGISRDLASTRGDTNLASIAVRHVMKVFDAKTAIFLPREERHVERVATTDPEHPLDDDELEIARWAYEHKQPAGFGTVTRSAARALYLPLIASGDAVGVLGIAQGSGQPFPRDERTYLDAFVTQVAVAVESAVRAAEAEQARMEAESEKLRNTLFSSVSHDLRTPLAAITGAAGVLRDDRSDLSTTQAELIDTIHVQAERLARLLTNLLEMARLESGALEVRREWQSIEEVVGSSLYRVRGKLVGRTVTADVPRSLPLVNVDAALIEVALLNLVENAIKYTPSGSPIDVSARSEPEGVLKVEVADRGPGIPPGEEERIFEKFHRAGHGSVVPGFGLGLTICRGIVEAHGGEVQATNRPGGGAVFSVSLPADGKPPTIGHGEPGQGSGDDTGATGPIVR